MIKSIIARLNVIFEKKVWRSENRHNETVMGNVFNRSLVSIGKKTYGILNVINHSDEYRLIVGNYCSIAPEVLFIVCGDHAINKISTFPFKAHCIDNSYEACSKGNIEIKDDVWIGARATILSGVTIGQGAVVASGSIVTHDVPPYSVVAGIPAKVIKKRFNNDIIDELLKIDFSKIDTNFILKNKELLDKNIETVDISWIKKFVDTVDNYR